MVLIQFVAMADLDEVPDGQTEDFYAIEMQKHIAKTALEDLDYFVKVYR
jgi:hypothetical protein